MEKQTSKLELIKKKLSEETVTFDINDTLVETVRKLRALRVGIRAKNLLAYYTDGPGKDREPTQREIDGVLMGGGISIPSCWEKCLRRMTT